MSSELARPCFAGSRPINAHATHWKQIKRAAQRPRRQVRAAAAAAAAAAGQPPPLRPVPRRNDYKQRVARQFDSRAPRYDCDNSYHPPLAARLVRLAALQAGEHVLDVATGTGLVALQAAREVGPAGSVLGVDLSPAMVDKLRAQQCAQVAAARAVLQPFAAMVGLRFPSNAPGQAAAPLGAPVPLTLKHCCCQPNDPQAKEKAQAAGLHNTKFVAGDAEDCTFGPDSFDAILCSSALPFFTDTPAALATWHSWLRPGGRVAFNAPKASAAGVRMWLPHMPAAVCGCCTVPAHLPCPVYAQTLHHKRRHSGQQAYITAPHACPPNS